MVRVERVQDLSFLSRRRDIDVIDDVQGRLELIMLDELILVCEQLFDFHDSFDVFEDLSGFLIFFFDLICFYIDRYAFLEPVVRQQCF